MVNKKRFKRMSILVLLSLIIYYISSIYLITQVYYYNSSKSFTTYLIYAAILFIIYTIYLFTKKGFIAIKVNKPKKYIKFLVISLVVVLVQIFISYNLNIVSKSLKKVTNDYSTYSSSLVVLNKSKYNDIDDLKNKKIGIIDNKDNIEGYVIPNEVIKKEDIKQKYIKKYDNYTDMLNDLYDKKIDAVFLSSSYASLFSNIEGFSDIKQKTKVILKETKKIKKTSNNKTLTEPFTVLIMGVDSEESNLSSSSSLNGDALMLITFNPNTMNATILSIPRDTYVPIACYKNKAKSKINAASYGGAECMIETIEDLTDIEIDYWVKVNFKGVIGLVDALGGIKVDVPYAFCESDSQRRFGKNTIYIEKGLQTLNGEQALAFARNRHPWPQYCPKKYTSYNSNDFIRGQNQQKIVNAMLNRLKNIKSLQEVYSILEVVGNNIDTNINKETMMTGFDTFTKLLTNAKNIDNEDFVGTQRLYLSGYDNYINNIYYYSYYEQSLKEVTDAMKINLELKKPEMIKEFEFSINKPYENKQIGKGTYKY